MDLIEILGDLLGQKPIRPGRDTEGPSDRDATRGQPRRRTAETGPVSEEQIKREAAELEELLNVAKQRRSAPPSSGQAPSNAGRANPPIPPRTAPRQPPQEQESAGVTDNDRAGVLIRAMVNAAKSDGRIDQAEQQRILGQLTNPTRATMEYLNRLFDEPLDTRRLADSVPVGMEKQVYMISLMALDLDSGSEAKYLVELGNALRISQDEREQIHQRMGAPSVY